MDDNIKPKNRDYLRGKEIDIALNNVFYYLNTIDLKPYLEEYKGKTVWELRERLDDDFPYEDDYSNSLFDAVSEYEIVEYLNKRYGLRIRESVETNYYIT